jgi:hypothetical protein
MRVTGDELVRVERLGHVVFGADQEAGDLEPLLVLAGLGLDGLVARSSARRRAARRSCGGVRRDQPVLSGSYEVGCT